MGADSSRQLDPEMVDKMQQSTAFTGPEIKEWYKRFKGQCPDGEMSREQFQVLYITLIASIEWPPVDSLPLLGLAPSNSPRIADVHSLFYIPDW